MCLVQLSTYRRFFDKPIGHPRNVSLSHNQVRLQMDIDNEATGMRVSIPMKATYSYAHRRLQTKYEPAATGTKMSLTCNFKHDRGAPFYVTLSDNDGNVACGEYYVLRQ